MTAMITILPPIAFLLLSSILIPHVSAHGYLASLGVSSNGQYTNYTGNVPNMDPFPSAIRQVSDISPVKGASNPDLNCGLNAQFAQKVANVSPGDLLVFDWRGGDNTNWPHNTGPLLTYMTSCGTQDCTQYNSSTSKWFKINEIGIVKNATSNDSPVWAQQSIMNGAFTNVTLPGVAPGNYLIRHEIIALHLATNLGGAEFYPACVQVTVGGSGTGKATDDEMILLPGGYKDTDPGIYDPNVYSSNSYVFPGPAVAAFVGSSSSSSSSPSGSTSAPNPTGTSSSSSGSAGSAAQTVCKLQRRFVVPRTNTSAYTRRHSKRTLRRSEVTPEYGEDQRPSRGISWSDMITAYQTLDLGLIFRTGL